MTAMRELIARICEGTKSIWFDPAHACKFHRADLILGVSAQNANVGLSSAYNPYPPGILPLTLNSETFRSCLLQLVDKLEKARREGQKEWWKDDDDD